MSVPIVCFARKEGATDWISIIPLQDQSFVLSKKLIDLENIESMRCDTTKTLYFPAEFSQNASFFGDFKNFNGTFNAFDFYEGRVLTYQGNEILIGSLYLVNYDRKRNLYEVQIASKVGSIKNRLGTKSIIDLPQSNYSHIYSWENIKSSWESDVGWRERIKYMPIDNGVGVGDVVNISTTPVNMSNLFYPCINIKKAISDIFSYMSFDFADLSTAPVTFLSIGGTQELTQVKQQTFYHGKQSVLPSILFPSGITSVNIGTLSIGGSDMATQFYEYYDDGLTLLYLGFQPKKNYFATFNRAIRIGNNTDSNVDARLRLVTVDDDLNQLSEIAVSAWIDVPIVSNGYSQVFDFGDLSVDILSSQKYSWVLDLQHYTFTAGVIYLGSNSSDSNFNAYGTASIGEYLKGVKLYDLLNIYRQLFGIYYIYDSNSSRFEAHSYASLISNGDTLNWTEKIEYINDFKSGSLINFIASKYRYLVKQNKGIVDFTTIQKDGIPYGSFDLDLTINSQQSEQKNELPTTTWVNSLYGGYKFFKNYEVISQPKQNEIPLIVAFFCGRETVTTYNIIDEANVNRTFGWMPLFENTKNGLILAFNRVDQYNGNADNSTSASLFKAFHWLKFNEWIGLIFTDGVGASLDEAKLKKARILDVGVWLTANEFKTLTLGEKISITTPLGTDYFRILEVSGFDLLGRKSCNVKLIRIV